MTSQKALLSLELVCITIFLVFSKLLLNLEACCIVAFNTEACSIFL
jgi:hypothetical protein